MSPRTTAAPQRSRNVQADGPNWILIAGSALLSTLSIRFGYKLKEVFDAKQLNSSQSSKVNGKSTERKKSGSCHLSPNAFCFPQDEDGCYNHYSGSRNVVEIKQHCNREMTEMSLPLVSAPTTDFNKENGVMWSSSPDLLELPQKPFNNSNSSESPCVSESGSDIFSKREVIQKLRQQLRTRDDTTLEMQTQIAALQNSLSAQISHSSHLQSLLDAANRDLLDSQREIQRLRKAIADHCVGHPEGRKGHVNGYPEVGRSLESSEKDRDAEKIEMLRREVSELKELIEGKDYLLQSYKEQKSELSMKIKELQQRLDAQLPNIF